jgi:hypothetical protein
MQRDVLLSGTFCAAAVAMTALVVVSTALDAQRPAEAYTASGCGMFDGKLCKTVTTTSCTGNTCTEETSYYYYATPVIE